MMTKIIMVIARIALNLALPFIAIGFGAQVRKIAHGLSLSNSRWSAFLLGIVVFIPVWFVGQRLMPRVVSYLTTLEHELTHILVGLLFLIRPVSIRVTATQGGEVVLTGSNIWITLALFFPLCG